MASPAADAAGKGVQMFETGKEKVVAIGAGAVAGLVLLGGAAFAQTPGATSTPSAEGTPSTTATATATADGSGRHQKDGTDCPHDKGEDQSGSSSSSSSSSGT
ncbi:MAG: hypothetical protein AB7L91_03070 [Dehalococcoidia bacterium]